MAESTEPLAEKIVVDGVRIPYCLDHNEHSGRTELREIQPSGAQGEIVMNFVSQEHARLWVEQAHRNNRLRR
jgi:hypothetical protein